MLSCSDVDTKFSTVISHAAVSVLRMTIVGPMVFMGRPFQVSVLLRNFHSMDRCLPTFSLSRPVWPFTAGRAQMGCLHEARKACGAVGGFFISVAERS